MNNCPNCGSIVNPGESFCRSCGTKISAPQNNIFIDLQESQSNNNQINPTFQDFSQSHDGGNVDDDELVDAYIGKYADKFRSGGFSGWSFLFGNLYALYRKMWLLGVIWVVVTLIAMKFLPSYVTFITGCMNLIVAIQFKKWYLRHAEEEVEKIKAKNPGKTGEQLKMICKKKGGTTIIPIVIAVLLYAAIMYMTVMSVSKTMQKARENAEIINNGGSNNGGTVSTTSALDKLNVSVPSIFDLTYSGSTIKTYYSNDSTKDYCFFEVSYTDASIYNNDAKYFLEENIYLSANDSYSGISQKYINGRNWYYASVNKSYGTKYYYAIMNGIYIYNIEFEIMRDDYGTCSGAHNTVVNSLGFK